MTQRPTTAAGRKEVRRRGRAPSAAAAERDLLAAMIDGANDAIIGTTLDGTITHWNRAAVTLLGYTAGEAIGQSVTLLTLPGEFEVEVAARIRRALDGEVLRNERTVLIRKDGTRFDAFGNISCVRDADGAPIAFMIVPRDVTEQERAEATLRSIVDSLPVRVFWKDRECRYLGCNTLFAQDAGRMSPSDLIGKTDFEVAWKAQAQAYREDDEKVMATGVSKLGYEEEQTTPDGRTIWLSTSKAPLRDGHGRVVGIVGTYQDVTEHKRSEEALRESEERYRSILNASPDGVVITNMESRVLMVSPVALKMLGAEERDIVGHPILDFIAPEDRQLAASNLALRVKGLRTEAAEYRGQRLDGRTFDIEVNAAPIRDASGRPAQLVITVRDITARKQSEEALRASEERYRSVLTASPDGVAITDLEGRVIMASPAGLEMLGAEEREVLGHPLDTFIVPEDRPRLASKIVLRMKGLRPEGGEYRAQRLDGGTFDIQANAALVLDALGRPAQMVVTFRDVTARKREQEMLAASLREKEGLLKETHHRVKNNLALITSLMRITGGQSSEPETRVVLKEMAVRIHSVLLLNEMLYKTASYTEVNLAEYLTQLATHAFRAQTAGAANLQLILEISPVDVPTAQAIPCGLIVNELMTNSLKHAFPVGQGGELRIALGHNATGAIQLEVSDSGVGLPEDFELRRGKSLGLQLVSDLARQLGGRLDILGGPGVRFRVTFAATVSP